MYITTELRDLHWKLADAEKEVEKIKLDISEHERLFYAGLADVEREVEAEMDKMKHKHERERIEQEKTMGRCIRMAIAEYERDRAEA